MREGKGEREEKYKSVLPKSCAPKNYLDDPSGAIQNMSGLKTWKLHLKELLNQKHQGGSTLEE